VSQKKLRIFGEKRGDAGGGCPPNGKGKCERPHKKDLTRKRKQLALTTTKNPWGEEFRNLNTTLQKDEEKNSPKKEKDRSEKKEGDDEPWKTAGGHRGHCAVRGGGFDSRGKGYGD